MENLIQKSDLTGKTVIVTGSNTGIGKETARELARTGARVILACRNTEKANEARDEIVADTKNDNVVVMILDLASLQSVREFANNFNSNEARLDILVNNAGVVTKERRETSDGFEMMFGTNHLGHFLLTNLLLDKLKSSAPSRVVTVSSYAHGHNPVKFNDLQFEKSFALMRAYGSSKSANVMFSVHLAKLLEGTGVTTYSLHPGAVRTELGREYENKCIWCLISCLVRIICCESVLDSAEGAWTTLYCCLEPSIANVSGRYYSNCREKTAKSHATNPESAKKLWDISCELTGLTEN